MKTCEESHSPGLAPSWKITAGGMNLVPGVDSVGVGGCWERVRRWGGEGGVVSMALMEDKIRVRV